MPFYFTKLDYEALRQELVDYINGLPNAQWQDYIESSTGSQIIDLLAGVSALLQNSVGIARREVYATSAKLRSSLIHIANTMGYPVNRESALEIELTFIPNTTQSWSKYNPIGTLDGKPLVLIQDESFNSGVSTTVTAVVGEWNSTSISTTSDKYQRYSILETVDNFHYELRDSSGNVIPLRTDLWDIDPNSAIIVTTARGVDLVSGDDILAKRFVGDILTFEWISPVEATASGTPNLTVGTPQSYSVVKTYSSGDSVRKLSVVIPGFRASRGRAVTISDYKYIIMSYMGSIVDGVARKHPTECCKMQISYAMDDNSILTTTQKNDLIDYLRYRSLAGIRHEVVDPVHSVVQVNGRIYVSRSSNRTTTDVAADVNDYINNFRTQLGEPLYSGDIVVDISRIEGVDRVYLDDGSGGVFQDITSQAWNEYITLTPNLQYYYS